MSEPRTYTGGCHCGKVRYEVTGALAKAMECNCSICSRRAHRLSFVPEAQFKLLSGADALTDYQFNKKNIHHLFCSTCGIGSFTWGTGADGAKMYSINVRCLDDFDQEAIEIWHFDGKNR
jgi:hypothetical protein